MEKINRAKYEQMKDEENLVTYYKILQRLQQFINFDKMKCNNFGKSSYEGSIYLSNEYLQLSLLKGSKCPYEQISKFSFEPKTNIFFLYF